jgi:hypothetical protein
MIEHPYLVQKTWIGYKSCFTITTSTCKTLHMNGISPWSIKDVIHQSHYTNHRSPCKCVNYLKHQVAFVDASLYLLFYLLLQSDPLSYAKLLLTYPFLTQFWNIRCNIGRSSHIWCLLNILCMGVWGDGMLITTFPFKTWSNRKHLHHFNKHLNTSSNLFTYVTY